MPPKRSSSLVWMSKLIYRSFRRHWHFYKLYDLKALLMIYVNNYFYKFGELSSKWFVRYCIHITCFDWNECSTKYSSDPPYFMVFFYKWSSCLAKYYHLSVKNNSVKIWLICYISIQKSSSEGDSYSPLKTARWSKNYQLSGTNTYNKYFRICLSYDWVNGRHWTANKLSEDQQVSRIFHSFRKHYFVREGLQIKDYICM